MKHLRTPLSPGTLRSLRAGEWVLFSGSVYTARDQAHRLIAADLAAGKALPVDLRAQAAYYCGPTRTPAGRVIGSCGPTTSSRMDPFTAPLLAAGVTLLIGKGGRSAEVYRLLKRHGAVYCVTIGGAGAYLAQTVCSCRVVAYAHLGPEAVYELVVRDFPLLVAGDARGRTIYPARVRTGKGTRYE